MMVFKTCPHLIGSAVPGSPSPVMILARLAVDLGHKGAGAPKPPVSHGFMGATYFLSSVHQPARSQAPTESRCSLPPIPTEQ